ncbi:MAG: hypothetical protein GY820_00990 [Gammaproteobacteria bacterium]|nr:hypothetical protein [Gammaproteobacteria bacterium]
MNDEEFQKYLDSCFDELEEVRFRRVVEVSIRAADRGKFVNKNELQIAFARWNVNIGS